MLREKLEQSRLMRKLASLMGSRVYWNLASLRERDAMFTATRTISEEEFETAGEKLASRLVKKMPANPVVLDFGCGIGRPEKYLAPHCMEIYGVDISRAMLRLARRRHKDYPKMHFIKSKGTSIPLGDSMFDFIFSDVVLQHLPKENVVLVLAELFRLLKPGGAIYIQFPNLANSEMLDKYIIACNKGITPIIVRCWLPDELRLILEKLGYNIIDLELRGSDIWAWAEKGLVGRLDASAVAD